jgi:HSP20 family protein
MTKKEPSRLSGFWGRDPLTSMREEFDHMMSRFGDWERGWFGSAAVPAVDLSETDNALEARVDLPGFKSSEIDIQVTDNILTVSGQRTEEKEEKKGNGKAFHRIERKMGTFSRSIVLPCAVNRDKVDASYKDGVLSITLPKSEDAKAHKVKIKEV